MNIAGNIIKHHLRNVLFVCGSACAGKTTMSRLLAERHGLFLYDFDDERRYAEHRSIADEANQPYTCTHGADFHEQWTAPPEEGARRNMESMREQNEMTVIDLIKLSENRKVVADILYSPDFSPENLDYRQIVFLTVEKSIIRESYFDRPDKRGFYEYVKSQPLADVYFENIFRSLELTNELERRMMEQSGFLVLERTRRSVPESTLREIEKHFGLR